MEESLPEYVFVGSYNPEAEHHGVGISVLTRDPTSGRLADTGRVIPASNPGFLAVDENRRVLLAVDTSVRSSVSSFRIGTDGSLKRVNEEFTGGGGACHLAIDTVAGLVAVANYWDGSVSLHRIRDDGSVSSPVDRQVHEGHGPDRDKQAGPHAHSVAFVNDGTHLFAADLGADAVFVYEVLPSRRLRPVGRAAARPGAGPRHMVVQGSRVHVTCQLNSTVETFRWEGDPANLALEEDHPAVADDDGRPNFPSDIALSDDGHRVMVANRGANVVTVFAATPAGLVAGGDLDCGGQWPWHMALRGRHLYVANQRTDTVAQLDLSGDVDGVKPESPSLVTTASPLCVVLARLS